MFVFVCMCMFVRECVYVCMCVCVSVCAYVFTRVFLVHAEPCVLLCVLMSVLCCINMSMFVRVSEFGRFLCLCVKYRRSFVRACVFVCLCVCWCECNGGYNVRVCKCQYPCCMLHTMNLWQSTCVFSKV